MRQLLARLRSALFVITRKQGPVYTFARTTMAPLHDSNGFAWEAELESSYTVPVTIESLRAFEEAFTRAPSPRS